MAPLKIRFEWDENKAESNYRKHGIRFEDAATVFLDQHRLLELDPCEFEERWRTIGKSEVSLLFFVVHTARDKAGTEIIRVISARHAKSSERRRYYGNR